MGSRGTLLVEKEESAMLVPERGGKGIAVAVTKTDGGPVLDASATSGGPAKKIVPCPFTMMVSSDIAGT